MTQFLSLLMNGVSLGAIYALIALGFVIIFKASEVVSFTHGSLLLLGAYTIARLSDPLGFWLAALVGIVVTALAALIVERLIINRLRGAPVISLAIVTIGVDIILLTELIRRIGSDILNVPHPWGGGSFRIGDVGISQNRLIATLVAGVLIALFFVAFKYSSWGVSMRASAEDGETAALMGIRLGRVSALAWVVAGVLAGVAALFLVGSPTPGVTPDRLHRRAPRLPGRDPRWSGLHRRRAGGWAADRYRPSPWPPATRTSCCSSAAGSATSSRTS